MLAFIIFLLFSPVIYTQNAGDIPTDATGKCEEFADEPATCSDYVDYQVWIYKNDTQSEVADRNMDDIDDIIDIDVPLSCKSKAERFACGNVFLRCQTDSKANVTVDLPRPLCKSVCRDFVSACEKPFETAGKDEFIPDCDKQQNGQDVYPETSRSYNISGEEFTVNCFEPDEGDTDCIEIPGVQECSANTILSWVVHY